MVDRGLFANWRFRRFSYQTSAIIIVLILFITAANIVIISHWSKTFTIDVGAAGDGFFLRGFFPAEHTTDGITFRWSSANAALLLPDPLVAYTLSMRLHTDIQRFTTANEHVLTLQTANSQAIQLALQPGWRTYQILERPQTQTALQLQPISLAVALDQQGTRALGVVIDTVSVKPINIPILAILLILVIIGWWFILLLWANRIVLNALQTIDSPLHMISQQLFGLVLAIVTLCWLWYDPFILIWILAAHPAYLLISSITLACISFISRTIIIEQQASIA